MAYLYLRFIMTFFKRAINDKGKLTMSLILYLFMFQGYKTLDKAKKMRQLFKNISETFSSNCALETTLKRISNHAI